MTRTSDSKAYDRLVQSLLGSLETTTLHDEHDVDPETIIESHAEDLAYLQRFDALHERWVARVPYGRGKSSQYWFTALEDQLERPGQDAADRAVQQALAVIEADALTFGNPVQLLRQCSGTLSDVVQAISKKFFLQLQQKADAGELPTLHVPGGSVARVVISAKESQEPTGGTMSDVETPAPAPQAGQTIEFFVKDCVALADAPIARRRFPPAQQLHRTTLEELRPFLSLYRGKLVRPGQSGSHEFQCVTLFNLYVLAYSTDPALTRKKSSSRPRRRGHRRRRVTVPASIQQYSTRSSVLPSLLLGLVLLLVIGVGGSLYVDPHPGGRDTDEQPQGGAALHTPQETVEAQHAAEDVEDAEKAEPDTTDSQFSAKDFDLLARKVLRILQEDPGNLPQVVYLKFSKTLESDKDAFKGDKYASWVKLRLADVCIENQITPRELAFLIES